MTNIYIHRVYIYLFYVTNLNNTNYRYEYIIIL